MSGRPDNACALDVDAIHDLYEALEHAKAMLEEYEHEATGEHFNSLMINAALAKARGKR